MRKVFFALALGLAAASFVGCGQKKTTSDIITRKAAKPVVSSPVRMQEYSQEKTLDWGGGTVTCKIRCTACDSLPMVKDETGQKFVDNAISLTITRGDGSLLLAKTFTKESFNAALDDDYRRTGILEGLVFDRIEGGNLRFAASVCHPQTDEYIPLVVEVSHSGQVNVLRDTQLDTNADGATAADDGDDDGDR